MKIKLLMPIQKKWLDMIIGGEKKLEFRNRLLKDMKPGTVVELYESKGKWVSHLRKFSQNECEDCTIDCDYCNFLTGCEIDGKMIPRENGGKYEGSGKVVARFTIGEIYKYEKYKRGDSEVICNTTFDIEFFEDTIGYLKLIKQGYDNHKYAIGITNLEVYEEPRELDEFYSVSRLKKGAYNYYQNQEVVDTLTYQELYDLVKEVECETKKQNMYKPLARVTKAPQSTMRILEVE